MCVPSETAPTVVASKSLLYKTGSQILIILYLPFLIRAHDPINKFDANDEPIFPTPHDVDGMYEKYQNVIKSIKERFRILYNISADSVDAIFTVIIVADKKYHVERMCSNGVFQVFSYHNKWVDLFKGMGLPVVVSDLAFDPLGVFNILCATKAEFPHLYESLCDLSLMILPFNKFIMSAFDDDIVFPMQCAGSDLCDCRVNPDFHCGIIESVQITDPRLALIDNRMKSNDISPSLRTWYDAVRYHQAGTMHPQSLCSHVMEGSMLMKPEGSIRLSHKATVDMLISSHTAWKHIGLIVDDFMRCVFARTDDSEILPPVEVSASLVCFFLTHLTLIRNPRFFNSL